MPQALAPAAEPGQGTEAVGILLDAAVLIALPIGYYGVAKKTRISA